jgi:hypothetical protein
VVYYFIAGKPKTILVKAESEGEVS